MEDAHMQCADAMGRLLQRFFISMRIVVMNVHQKYSMYKERVGSEWVDNESRRPESRGARDGELQLATRRGSERREKRRERARKGGPLPSYVWVYDE